MPRQAAVTVENNFRNGLITEASGLNFPESACTETYDCIFDFDGSVRRRLGLDFETNYATKTIDRDGSVVSSYIWRNVVGDGTINLLVLQVGSTLYFYDTSDAPISAGALATTVDLTNHSTVGAPTPETVECQFTSGDRFLFITHPYIEPIRVEYDSITQVVSATEIILKIRDFAGDPDDPYGIDERPTATVGTLNVHHLYNLYNQGWNATNLATWDTAFTHMPSNADIMWAFKNSSDAFDTATEPNVIAGNTKAARGHFILEVADQDRDTAAGTTGATSDGTGYQRPRTSAFHAGRMFFSGLNYAGFNSHIYFTQVIESNEQYGFCYQQNDPTSEDASDLLPADGGVIAIHEAGTIHKLYSIPGMLLVFAQNGIWAIAGSQGIGFAANDYTVSKISTINTISATSFVDIAGFPSWWNAEGIFVIGMEGNTPQVQSLDR